VKRWIVLLAVYFAVFAFGLLCGVRYADDHWKQFR
jgi:hypothetical protein